MQGKKLICALGSLTVLAFATPAFAIMSVPMGWYLEANAGSSDQSNTDYPGNSSTSGIGGNVNIGYKFIPYFGMELGYTRYSNPSIKNSAGTTAGTVKVYSYDLAARGIFPFWDTGAEAFAKLGVGRMNNSISISDATAATALGLSSSSHSATGYFLAVGAQYYFIPEFAVNVQWARSEGNSSTGNGELLSAGVSFIFD